MTDERGHTAQSDTESLAGWPKNVRPISVNGMIHLGVSDDGELYWDGKPVVIRRGIDLTAWQTTLATLTAFSALVVAGVDILNFYGYGLP